MAAGKEHNSALAAVVVVTLDVDTPWMDDTEIIVQGVIRASRLFSLFLHIFVIATESSPAVHSLFIYCSGRCVCHFFVLFPYILNQWTVLCSRIRSHSRIFLPSVSRSVWAFLTRYQNSHLPQAR